MAAEDSDLERTEPATPRRVEKAREEGDVPRSKELSTVSVLLTVLVAIWASGAQMTQALRTNMAGGLSLPRNLAYEPELLIVSIARQFSDLVWAMLTIRSSGS
jgi:flagellar biosynthetic protein FlhB